MSSIHEYDAIIIGGGSAGLTASGLAANFGAKTMLIEAERLGGDCTWTGCVPSKTLLKAAKVAHQIRNAGKYGLIDAEPEIDFKKLIDHLHGIRTHLYEEGDKPEIYEQMGIAVVQGKASFLDPHTVEIDLKAGGNQIVSSRYFLVCTGGKPQIPSIKGIKDVPYLTNESFFEIENLPQRLTIVGAGPVGTEIAQAMNRLGAEVTVIDMAGRILENDDPEMAQILYQSLEKEGISFLLNASIEQAAKKDGEIKVSVNQYGDTLEITGDGLLLATGREPNIRDLNLDKAGINISNKGIEVDDRCRTNINHIYACGDVTGRYQFTHMSDHMAKVAATHALLKYPMKIDAIHVPWVTYTDPELGHLGATRSQLEDEAASFETYRFPYSKIDRAVTESETEGLIKIYAKKWSGKILGVDILGVHAGELISEYAVAMSNGLSLRDIADTIHPYPSYGLGARRAADQWYIKNQKEWLVKLIKKVFGYRGEIPDYSDPGRIV